MIKRLSLIYILSFLLVLFAHAADDKPLILVTNDDGIKSVGIKSLALELMKLGEVVVVAPRNNRSGSSHSYPSKDSTSYEKIEFIGGVESYWVDSSPVVCVRWAISGLLQGRLPDLVVSGINHGSNFGQNVYYSGTVGAAREAALLGTVGIAASLWYPGDFQDFKGAARVVRKIAQNVLRLGKKPFLLNLNFPSGKIDESRKIKVVRLTHAKWKTHFDHEKNQEGDTHFSSKMQMELKNLEQDSDLAALMKGIITVTPMLFDPTEWGEMKKIEELIINGLIEK